jgi:hypothetical protein
MELNVASYQGGCDEINRIVLREMGGSEFVTETTAIGKDIMPRFLEIHINLMKEAGTALVIKTSHQKVSYPIQIKTEPDSDRVSYQIKIDDTWLSLTQVMWRDVLTDESRQAFTKNRIKTVGNQDRISVGSIIGIVFLVLLVGVILLALANPEIALIVFLLFLVVISGNGSSLF